MLGKILLATTCIVATTSAAAAESVTAPVLLADNSANKAGMSKSVEIKGAATHQTDYMVRASEFIGEEVYNGKGDEIGSVDDLILQKDDKVLYAVISVGGFLGIGDKLVAVPFRELKVGVEEVDGLIVYDRTKEQLKAQPEFHYAVAKDDKSRARFMRSAERQLDRWQGRIQRNMDHAKENAKDMKEGASKRVEDAWAKAKSEWQDLKNASADAWDDAKRKFDDAMADLERAWDDAMS